MACKLIYFVPVDNELGECVLWEDLTETIWWTDIENKKLFSLAYHSKILETYNLPARLGSFAMIEGGHTFLAGFETGLATYEPITGTLEWLEEIYKEGSGIRLNDGRVDRQGRFWVGAMVENISPENKLEIAASLYQYSGDRILTVRATNLQISNSLCWSPDGTILYFADSPTNIIYAYDMVPETGQIGNKRIFAITEAGVHPDGSCVDADGCVWNAQWGAGQVVRYTPEGRVDYILKIPSSQPTCVSFGGPDLNQLIVTSSKLDMNQADAIKYPHSGSLFIYETPYKGIPETRFKFLT